MGLAAAREQPNTARMAEMRPTSDAPVGSFSFSRTAGTGRGHSVIIGSFLVSKFNGCSPAANLKDSISARCPLRPDGSGNGFGRLLIQNLPFEIAGGLPQTRPKSPLNFSARNSIAVSVEGVRHVSKRTHHQVSIPDASSAGGLTGSQTVKLVPCPTVLSTSIRPPCFCTMP